MSNVYLGIDPGASGGLAFLDEEFAAVTAMPPTRKDLWDWLHNEDLTKVFAVIEKVGGHVGDKQPGSRMFEFGRNYGECLMALTAAGVPHEEVPPQKWQKALGIPPRKKDESRTQWKNRLKAKAQQLFPGVKVTLSVADALLIAEFCRRMREGKLNGA